MGSFSGPFILSNSSASVRHMVWNDFDSIGHVDLAIACYDTNTIAWLKNLGGGVFSPPINITTTAIGVRWLAAEAVSADSYIDILSASSGDNRISIYVNLGWPSYSFSAAIIVSNETLSPFAIELVDCDGNGALDLVSASFADDRIAWFRWTGALSYTGPLNITTQADGARSVIGVDIDSDGDKDLVSASTNDGKIAWYRNDGSGNFETLLIANFTGARIVVSFDVDGDANEDVRRLVIVRRQVPGLLTCLSKCAGAERVGLSERRCHVPQQRNWRIFRADYNRECVHCQWHNVRHLRAPERFCLSRRAYCFES